MNIGSHIRQGRERAGMKRQTLAKLCNVSRPYIHCIEVGDYTPSAALCAQISLHLDLDKDVTLLLAGHVPADVLTLLREYPQDGCEMLRRQLLPIMEGK